MAFPEVAFPSKQLSEISQKLYDLENHETFLQYGPSEGHPEFLTALGKRLSSVVNVYDSDTDDLMVVSGSTQGMDLTVKAFCNEGDIVIL
jgi:2-aminoadipate transaminase